MARSWSHATGTGLVNCALSASWKMGGRASRSKRTLGEVAGDSKGGFMKWQVLAKWEDCAYII